MIPPESISLNLKPLFALHSALCLYALYSVQNWLPALCTFFHLHCVPFRHAYKNNTCQSTAGNVYNNVYSQWTFACSFFLLFLLSYISVSMFFLLGKPRVYFLGAIPGSDVWVTGIPDSRSLYRALLIVYSLQSLEHPKHSYSHNGLKE